MKTPRSRSFAAARPRRAQPHLAALVLVGVLAAACGGASEVDEVDDAAGEPVDVAAPAGNETGDAADPVSEDTSSDDAPDTDDAADETDNTPDETAMPSDASDAPVRDDEGDDATATLTSAFDEDRLTVTGTDGSVKGTWEHPNERLDSFTQVIVRPGATATELDAIVVVLRGEVYRLYHLEVSEGSDGAFTELPDYLQPQDVMESTIDVVWTPDVDSVLWTEPTPDGVTLRSFGWQDGPGTGRTADDNATFALDLPADVRIDGFTAQTDTRWTVKLVDGLGETHELAMERQGDGAIALT